MNFVGSDYVHNYLCETCDIATQMDKQAIETLVAWLAKTADSPRGVVYVLGLGGSLANATHLAADLRQGTRCRAAAPESLPELTALANDHTWTTLFSQWLAARPLTASDLVLVLSVGGGNWPAGVSVPLAEALHYAQGIGAATAGIVGEPGGVCAAVADVVVRIPTVAPARKTAHCEGWQMVLGHLIVNHPRLRRTGC